ncbi:MAG: lipocalin family protein [Mycolicibacterium sp.]|uniref:lipocalin family protein n=1 Tax=Mycolicibacterium sp. TaxID=2320850 RepID=UPI003D0BBEAD
MCEQRVWWGAGLVFVGFGAALLTGAGLAAADTDSSDPGSSSSLGGTAEGESSADDPRASRAEPAQAADAGPGTVPASARIETARATAASGADETAAGGADDTDADDTDAGDADDRTIGATAKDDPPHVETTLDEDQNGGPVSALAEPTADAGAVPSARSTAPVAPADQDREAEQNREGARAAANAAESPVAAHDGPRDAQAAALASSDTVTGVKTGHSKLTIPLGNGYTTQADWYLPTLADGSVAADGVIWLQHGFLNRKSFVSALAATLSQQTNSIVVAPNVASFPWRCAGCWLNGAELRQAVATMFLGDRAELNSSATAAGYVGTLPQSFVLSGQSAGGGFATVVGGYYASDPGSDGSLRGVVMFDGVAIGGVLTDALHSLDDPYIPVYQVAAPPQLWNAFGSTTTELVDARPGRFVGVTLAGGSHADSLLGGIPIIDFFAQLVTKFSPPGNTAATHTLATGWINDMYQGLGPVDGNGIYGLPDQYIVMGDTAAVVLGPPPVVDVDRYLGTWYEVGSVKQFFSIGLVNTKAVYSLNTDGSIRVENSGNYFFNNGPEVEIVGAALPVDPTNNKLNVRFFGPASDRPPGNYWIVDLSPDYDGPNGWAIVSDPTGFSGFLLSRSAIVSDELYQELLNRASVKGVRGWITRTRQPGATTVAA